MRADRTWLVAGAMMVAACGSGRPKPVAPTQVGIGEVKIVGATAVDAEDIESGLGVIRARALGQPFARYLVALDKSRIEGYYLRRGFFKATALAAVSERGRLVDVTFTVTEGPRARLVAVDITGLPDDVDRDELRDKIPLADNQTFDYEAYELSRPTLVAVLEEKGYAHAMVNGTVIADKEHGIATIRLIVDAGPRAVFGEVKVTGVQGQLAASVKKRLHIKPGDRYSLHALADSRADLYELGRFSLVRLEADKTGRGPVVPVEIKLGLSPRNELRAGGGVGYNPISYEIRGRGSYGINGWPAPLWNAHAELRPAVVKLKDENDYQPRVEAVGVLERLDLFLPRVIGSTEASFSYLALEAYTSYGPRLHLGLRAPLYRRIVSASVGWKIQELRFRNLDAAVDAMTATRLGLDGPERIGAFDQSLIVDLRDNPLSPTHGVYGGIRGEEGTQAAGGAFDYVRVMPEVRGYYTAFGTTLALRLGGGAFYGDVPVTARFFAGGAASQRGFGERRLAPQVVATIDGNERRVPYGGGGMILTSAELRRQLATIGKEATLGGVVFLDGADVTERAADLDVSKLHWAIGAGLRLKYIVPVRFDVGYRLNRIGPMDPDPTTSTWGRIALHLSIGEAF